MKNSSVPVTTVIRSEVVPTSGGSCLFVYMYWVLITSVLFGRKLSPRPVCCLLSTSLIQPYLLAFALEPEDTSTTVNFASDVVADPSLLSPEPVTNSKSQCRANVDNLGTYLPARLDFNKYAFSSGLDTPKFLGSRACALISSSDRYENQYLALETLTSEFCFKAPVVFCRCAPTNTLFATLKKSKELV